MTKEQFIVLLEKYHRQQLSADELSAFLDAAGDPSFESLITDRLYEELQEVKPDADAGEEREQLVWNRVQYSIQPVRPVSIMRRWVWAAAAAVLIIGVGLYLQQGKKKAPLVAATTKSSDITPGKAGAVLTLADGSQVVLDSLGNGIVATQQGTKVLLKDGELAYEGNGMAVYNTITTPKGRQFQLTLPDGTKVWLNAASSLRYPTAFTGKERNVAVTGEAYFEVAQNVTQPFRVHVNNKADIDVLGTHFNVNAYDNEQAINATLLEGSVRVASNGNSVVLKPGQQAKVAQDINVMQQVDIDKVMAWRNGLFNFEGASLEEVVKQLERWYDIEVVYENNPPNIRFVGKMDKSIPLKDLLEILEKSNVHFKLEEGRKLIVKQ